MNLKNDIESLKHKIIQNNIDAVEEEISIKDVNKALVNVKFMALETVEDYFLFFSSLNLLNSYVKKDYAVSDRYDFKEEVTKGIESLIVWNPEEINYSYNKSLSIIDFNGFQFSFHNVKISELMKQKKLYCKQINWEGIRLQPSAVTIFEFANSLSGLSKKSMFGFSLNELYNNYKVIIEKKI